MAKGGSALDIKFGIRGILSKYCHRLCSKETLKQHSKKKAVVKLQTHFNCLKTCEGVKINTFFCKQNIYLQRLFLNKTTV